MSLSAERWLSYLMIFFYMPVLSQETAPYSRYGLGEITPPYFTAQKGMGGLVAAYREPLQINFLNPASYSAIRLTTLEAGANFIHKNMHDASSDRRYSTGNGFLDYIALGFPVSERSGISVGLIPYSKMNYAFRETQNVTGVGDIQKSYSGNGRLYQFYAGGAFRFPKADTTTNSFSIGLNAAYVFGTISRIDTFIFPDAATYNNKVSTLVHMNNLALGTGIQYTRQLKKQLQLTSGVYALFPAYSNSRQEDLWERVLTFRTIDTIASASSRNKAVKTPVEVGAGLTVGKAGKWLAGADFYYKVWTAIPSFSPKAELKNSWEIHAGGEFIPNSQSFNFFRRTAYRMGIYYNSGHLQLYKENIAEYGITFGIGMPIKTAFARIHITMDIGQRGTLKNNLIKETYYRAHVGFTLNDKWFIKRKYD
ncbi:MAG: membrane protein [Chitinophagales bacterium]|nr:MAG: membrane protein [Chitinophagales bacterium]